MLLDLTTGIPSMIHDVQTLVSGNGSWQDKLLAGGDLLLNVAMDASMLIGVGEAVRAVYLGVRLGADVALHAGEEALAHEGEKAVEQGIADSVEHAAACVGLSFAAATPVSTAVGKQAIGTLHIGQKVLAYNPNTHKMELEPILHVWINHDHDLVDLTLTTLVKGTHGHPATQKSEVLHTNERHPFLTEEKGFLPVSQLRLGMHIERANSNVGVVTKEQVVPGVQTMYNLEVAQDHTYTVGDGQWVVHNCGAGDLGSYGSLTKDASGTGLQAHHIFQDAMMRNLPGYSRDLAPAILLKETDHIAATSVQRSMGTGLRSLARFFGFHSLSFTEADDVARQALRAGGVGGTEFDNAMKYATDYFTSQWSPADLDNLRIPSR